MSEASSLEDQARDSLSAYRAALNKLEIYGHNTGTGTQYVCRFSRLIPQALHLQRAARSFKSSHPMNSDIREIVEKSTEQVEELRKQETKWRQYGNNTGTGLQIADRMRPFVERARRLLSAVTNMARNQACSSSFGIFKTSIQVRRTILSRPDDSDDE